MSSSIVSAEALSPTPTVRPAVVGGDRLPPVERLDGEAFTYVGPPPPGGTSASAGMFIRAGQRYFGKAWVRDTTHETLVAALWEILANDIFRYFGCHAQRLCLSLQRWLAGSEAFTRDPSCPPAGVHLLSEWIDGFCVLGPEFVSQLASGTFSDIAASVSVPGGSAPLHGLGAILAVAMLVGDSDSVGGKGANVGFTLLKDEDNSVVGAQAIKIDPGMAFALLSAPNPSKACRKSLNDIRSRRVSIHTGKQVAFDTLPARVRQEFTGIVRELRGINADHVTSFFLRPGMEDLFADPREAQGRIDFVLSRLAAMLETYGGEAAAASGDLDDPAAVLRAIKEGYARDAVLRDPVTGTKFPIEKRFVNLSLLEERKAEEGDAQLGGLNSFEAIRAGKLEVTLPALFSKCRGLTKRVNLVGSAGIGKSTVCQCIVSQWSSGSLFPEFPLVLWVHLRHMTSERYPMGDNYTVLDVIARECLGVPLSPRLRSALGSLYDPYRSLWILDGYDEIVGRVPAHLSPAFTHMMSGHNRLLTGRPHAMMSLPCDVRVEVAGFRDENITEFVGRFLNAMAADPGAGSVNPRTHPVYGYMRSHPLVWELAHVPINLVLLCHVLQDGAIDTDLSLTELYAHVEERMWRR